MIRNDSKAFRDIVDAVARTIVSAEHRDGSSYIQTPLLYPNGTTVVIRINDAYPKFLVTDFGTGYSEAEMIGASTIFSRHARKIAEHAGIGFDNHSFFVAEATREQLPGVVVAVANCSQEAVAVAAYRLADRRFADDTEKLYDRLVTAFPRQIVAKDAEIVGQSNTRWHVATLVHADGRKTIFEPVSNHHASIFAVSTKFQDIAEVEDAPGRVAMVRRKSELNTYLAVLSRSANVVEHDVSDQTLIRLAAAA